MATKPIISMLQFTKFEQWPSALWNKKKNERKKLKIRIAKKALRALFCAKGGAQHTPSFEAPECSSWNSLPGTHLCPYSSSVLHFSLAFSSRGVNWISEQRVLITKCGRFITFGGGHWNSNRFVARTNHLSRIFSPGIEAHAALDAAVPVYLDDLSQN